MALPGCYVLQAAAGQAEVLSRSEPIEKLLADPATPAPLRARLDLVAEARRFAIEELGLADGRSFRKYADLGRPYAVWNVVAAPEFSVTPRRWCYPVAGCVAYRGYFDEARAEATARRLDASGDDVTIGGVATYSTLGYLPDPVFNTMLGWRETRLVGTVFHELAHERLYVPGDSEFNEAFASVVEQEGVRRWLLATMIRATGTARSQASAWASSRAPSPWPRSAAATTRARICPQRPSCSRQSPQQTLTTPTRPRSPSATRTR